MAQSTQEPPSGSRSADEVHPDLARGTMSFRDHLEELRRRVIISLLAVASCMLLFLFFKSEVMGVLIAPYHHAWDIAFDSWYEDFAKPEARTGFDAQALAEAESVDAYARSREDGTELPRYLVNRAIKAMQIHDFPLSPTLISITPLQDFIVFMLAAALFGLVLASPVVMWEMWKFIGAGLYHAERRVVMRYVPFSVGLFAAGVSFGYFVMVPYALRFLIALSDPGMVGPLYTVRDYFSFLFMLTAALGLVFQLPLIMLGLVKLGIASTEFYVRYWRHAILSFFVIGMLLTPPDPFTQVLMAGPLCILFVFGLVLSKVAGKRPAAEGADAGGEPSA
ncbi:MAG: twin-arginine translocase subunit TatC [Planctomycetota bacterium]